MMQNEYNGWSNYPTWRINLEMIDGMTPEDFGFNPRELDPESHNDVEDLAGAIEDYAYDLIEQTSTGIAQDLAKSFLNDVDWDDIAEHMMNDYATENV